MVYTSNVIALPSRRLRILPTSPGACRRPRAFTQRDGTHDGHSNAPSPKAVGERRSGASRHASVEGGEHSLQNQRPISRGDRQFVPARATESHVWRGGPRRRTPPNGEESRGNFPKAACHARKQLSTRGDSRRGFAVDGMALSREALEASSCGGVRTGANGMCIRSAVTPPLAPRRESLRRGHPFSSPSRGPASVGEAHASAAPDGRTFERTRGADGCHSNVAECI